MEINRPNTKQKKIFSVGFSSLDFSYKRLYNIDTKGGDNWKHNYTPTAF